MTRLITRLALWWLRRHSPAHLAQTAQRRRRAQPTKTPDDLWRERQITTIERRMR